MLFSLVAIHDLFVHQMDVKTIFFNVELEEEIYMDKLEGFVVHVKENKECKLDNSLYDLTHAPKQ